VSQGGNKSKTVLLELIQNAVFDGKNLSEHIEYMDGLIAQCEDTDFPISQAMRGQFMVNSVKRGGVARYEDALKYHEEANTSWDQVFTRLQEVESQHEIDCVKKRFNGIGRISNQVSMIDAGPQVNAVDGGKKAFKASGKVHNGDKIKRPDLKCKLCGMQGHTEDKCFKGMTCSKCGEKGHANFQCKAKPRVAKVSFAETEPEKVILTRAFTNKVPKPSST
jgi:hypothetical protein